MEITFTYSKKEWIEARRNYLLLSKTITKLQIVITLLFTLSLLLLSYYLKDDILYRILFFIDILSVGILSFLYILQPILLFSVTLKYQSPYRMKFTEDKINFETLGISSVLNWNIYHGYLENKRYIFLLRDKHNYTMIPKRAFKNKNDLIAFNRIINFNLTEGEH